MTAIKHTLQREVFLPSEERLIAVVHVTKAGKRKKASFLCAAVTTEKPINVLIYQVKKSDKGDTYKKKRSWALRELQVLDGRDASKDTAEFDMVFDKPYKWLASSIQDKNSFVGWLWKLSQRYMHTVQKPKFKNVPDQLVKDVTELASTDRSLQQVEDDIAVSTDQDYQALTAKEESDLESLMSQCENAISNTEAFAEQLASELSVLDGANIHSIMASEDQVLELMTLIDEGLREACGLEEELDVYNQKLQSVKDLMEMMKDKDTLIQVRNDNHQSLLEELDSIVKQLDLEHVHMKALLDGDLQSLGGIHECSKAAAALYSCMQAEIHPALKEMSAVQEQQKRFTKLRATFSKRLAHHLNNLFIHQGNEWETLSRYSTEQKLPIHSSSHRDLLPYADLMYWLKQVDRETVDREPFNHLVKEYTKNFKKLYEREIKEFMETAKVKLGQRQEKRAAMPGQKPASQTGSSSSLNKPFDSKSLKSASQSTLDSDSVHGSDSDILGRVKFDQMFEHVLSELGPVCLAEQDFCVKFFSLTSESEPKDPKSPDSASSDGGSPWKPRKPQSTQERQINEEVRKMMSDIFPSLETELHSFIAFGDRMDNFNSLYMLVRMSQHVINAEDTGSFNSKTYGNSLVQIKRCFDRFIQAQIRAIEETRYTKKVRIGIIPFVHNFEDFAHQAETIFKGSDRRMELDKAYVQLVTKIMDQIARVATDSQKAPSEVVMFENYHHMTSVLSKLKIACLESHRKDVKQKYQDHLQAYVTSYLGRPMEKLNTFFEGIESKVVAGVKEEEVGYQLAYNKQELRKVIKEYPGKEVKKGLEHLYKKVDKHLCDEENLLQVVWHKMQDEFLKQYTHFEQLIARCYPGAGITLDFTINDLLLYFSDIAQSH